jgi:hypothetical protein
MSKVNNGNKIDKIGTEEAIFKMLKSEGLITESEYAKCILALRKV